MIRILFILGLFFGQNSLAQADLPEGLYPGGTGVVEKILDGDTLLLADGREVRLQGILAPIRPLGHPNIKVWPLADAAKDALGDLVLGKGVKLYFGGREVDRHGRLLAHLITDDGLWVQTQMLQLGLAQVLSFSDNKIGIDELYKAESIARKNKLALWASNFYTVKCHFEARTLIDNFGLVQGRVLNVAEVKGVHYLNFGEDYREDFTVRVLKKTLKFFESAERLKNLEGKYIEVRGWIRFSGGPMIDASHAEQIKIMTKESQNYQAKCDL